ncbi:MAG: hypothetical protein SVP26_02610 [Chloroflexota bacterium]|nr:hypothetical protein [Chloroflexota bacterium]
MSGGSWTLVGLGALAVAVGLYYAGTATVLAHAARQEYMFLWPRWAPPRWMMESWTRAAKKLAMYWMLKRDSRIEVLQSEVVMRQGTAVFWTVLGAVLLSAAGLAA